MRVQARFGARGGACFSLLRSVLRSSCCCSLLPASCSKQHVTASGCGHGITRESHCTSSAAVQHHERSRRCDEVSSTLRLQLRSDQVGAVIGRGGVNINTIRDVSASAHWLFPSHGKVFAADG